MTRIMHRVPFKLLVTGLIFVYLTGICQAETIQLVDNRVYYGTILEINEDYVLLQTKSELMSIPRSQIWKIIVDRSTEKYGQQSTTRNFGGQRQVNELPVKSMVLGGVIGAGIGTGVGLMTAKKLLDNANDNSNGSMGEAIGESLAAALFGYVILLPLIFGLFTGLGVIIGKDIGQSKSDPVSKIDWPADFQSEKSPLFSEVTLLNFSF